SVAIEIAIASVIRRSMARCPFLGEGASIHSRMMQIVAHRGNARDHPENTLPAFESALALGVRHLELDVQLSRDRVPVVLHDATLRRTTGRAGRVFDVDAVELTRIDAAEARRFGTRHRGTTIPLLTDVLHLLDGWPDV